MAESTTSLGSKDISSTVSLYEPSSTTDLVDNLSTRAVYELDPEESISRPLSRGSVTSGVSMMATKDGVEGEKVKRLGIPQYSLNILNSMAHNQYKKLHHPSHSHLSLTKPYLNGATEASSISGKLGSYPDSPNAPPMTLREKMRLLNHDRNLSPSSNNNSTDQLDAASSNANSSTGRNHDIYSNGSDGNMLGVPGRCGSDIESNVSTVGDDASFSQNIRNLSPPVSVPDLSGEKV
ncbi:hypothetical protein HG536_0C05190 [Torulaspora globosa]|uniref:Uncharacterized protein n=1 Tax=Torulaspora globosa TaxID=48254 RepID=A0A7G3ZFR4_9SACH|nr:uncharacterized protein HG536_0C05190 [Torulaspora globosa]QLL32350.1 hypothetical protein HG536_0C05190 [Torulaspora globosa]